MSKTRKAIASAALLSAATGLYGASTLTAHAATPACGPGCLEVFSPRFGTASNPRFVETVLGGSAKTGTPLVLGRASDSSTASDIIPHLNKVAGFYASGMVSAGVNEHYGSLPAAQLEYAPSGHATGLCVGLERPAYSGESLSLQPCTVAGSTVFIVDIPDASKAGYTPLVIGSTTDFVHPLTMVYDGVPTDQPTPRIRVSQLRRNANGEVPIDQLFGTTHGVVHSDPQGAVQSAAPAAPAVKPTIVLVHGAWADSSSWSGEVSRLQQDGYPVIAAPNPLRGLSSDSATLADLLSTITGPIVLVGHSYGGAVISDAATGNPNVKALVYDDAYIPAEKENIATLSTAASALAPAVNNPTSVFKLVPYPGAPAGIYDTYLLPDVFYKSFGPDLPHSEAMTLEAEQSPTSLIAIGEGSSRPAWLTIPSWDVIGTQDQIIPEAAQLFMAHRAHAHITMVDSSHLSLITHPDVVTSVIESAAQATS
jgi:pimeloyl-ACP methyl ester carboxylesterase